MTRRTQSAASLLLAVVLTAGCSGRTPSNDADRSAAPTPTPATSIAPRATEVPSLAPSFPPATAFEVEVDGLTIVGHCSGIRVAGEPAVILQHGNGGGQNHLRRIEQHLATSRLVCAYDRPGGNGRSDLPGQRPRPIVEVATEAHEVVIAAGIEPPYFLVGQSAGAAITVVFAHLFAAEVAGFVASNPNPPYTAWIDAVRQVASEAEINSLELPDYRGENPEGIDFTGNDLMLEPLPASMPYAVLFDEDCRLLGFYCDRILEPLAQTQSLIADAGEGGRFLWVEGAGHEIPETEPELVFDMIDEVWGEALD